MKVQNYSDDRLKQELKASQLACANFSRALQCVPETSILGNLSITMSLKREKLRCNKLEDEARRRGIKL